MTLKSQVQTLILSFIISCPLYASDTSNNTDGNFFDSNYSFQDLKTYLLNLGEYFGYNLKITPSPSPDAASQMQADMSLWQNYLFNDSLGALLVNTAAQVTTPFVPDTTKQSYMNAFANETFNLTAYAQPSTQISVNPLIDQPTYQSDPVSQALLNILTTPDYSFCMDSNPETQWVGCKVPQMPQIQIMMNALAGNVSVGQPSTNDNSFPIPSSTDLLTTNSSILNQLNSNNLLTPLLYSTSNNQNCTSSSSCDNLPPGLNAPNQAQQAANFIRYVISAVAPIALADKGNYDFWWSKATEPNNPVDKDHLTARSKILTYVNSLRVYAAQSSVGISNLYYLLSRRMPQTQGNNVVTSEALSEFNMATRRIYNTQNQTNWLDQINNASSATVQKEIAGLLAEINYQLYLNRQQQERLLLTNTILLLQNARNTQPDPGILSRNQ